MQILISRDRQEHAVKQKTPSNTLTPLSSAIQARSEPEAADSVAADTPPYISLNLCFHTQLTASAHILFDRTRAQGE